MLVADVDYQQKRVLREVHLREVKHSASRRLEDVVRALVAEARDVGAEHVQGVRRVLLAGKQVGEQACRRGHHAVRR